MAGGRAEPRERESCQCLQIQNLVKMYRILNSSAPQDVSAVCLLARAEAIHNSSSPEDEARGLHSGER